MHVHITTDGTPGNTQVRLPDGRNLTDLIPISHLTVRIDKDQVIALAQIDHAALECNTALQLSDDDLHDLANAYGYDLVPSEVLDMIRERLAEELGIELPVQQ